MRFRLSRLAESTPPSLRLTVTWPFGCQFSSWGASAVRKQLPFSRSMIAAMLCRLLFKRVNECFETGDVRLTESGAQFSICYGLLLGESLDGRGLLGFSDVVVCCLHPFRFVAKIQRLRAIGVGDFVGSDTVMAFMVTRHIHQIAWHARGRGGRIGGLLELLASAEHTSPRKHQVL